MPHRIVRWRGACVLLAVIAMAAGIGQTNFGHSALEKAGLYEKPPGYTSLAFLNPQSLPEQLTLKEVSVDVSFVVGNAENISHSYQWSVSLVQGQRARHVTAGNVRVTSGGEAAVARSVQVSCIPGQVQHVRIVVSLARPAESIDALAECSLPEGRSPRTNTHGRGASPRPQKVRGVS